MEDLNWDRMVVVTAVHGERFHGWVPMSKGDPHEYLADCASKGRPAEIHNVRNLIGHKEPKLDAMGNFVGMASMMSLMAIDMFPEAMPTYHIIPSCWYFPTENDGAKKPMKALIDNAEQNEVRNRAIAAGITPAGPVPRGGH